MSAPILLILGNPCDPTRVRIDLNEDKELPMPHGIDDDLAGEPLNVAPRPSRTTAPVNNTYTFPLKTPEPVLAQSTPPVPEKIVYTGEDIAMLVAIFHNRLRSDLHGPWNNERFEIMISILTQDYLHSLLNR